MSVMEVATKTNFADLTFDQKLDRLAEVAVQVGSGAARGPGVDYVRSHGGAAAGAPNYGACL